MPKKTDPPMAQAEQSERFRKAVRELEADGGVSPTEAKAAFEKLMNQVGLDYEGGKDNRHTVF